MAERQRTTEQMTTSESVMKNDTADSETLQLKDRKGQDVPGGPATRRVGMDAEKQAEEEGQAATGESDKVDTTAWMEHHKAMQMHLDEFCKAAMNLQNSSELAQVLQHVQMIQLALHSLHAAERQRMSEAEAERSRQNEEQKV